jgi:hypothetical protein
MLAKNSKLIQISYIMNKHFFISAQNFKKAAKKIFEIHPPKDLTSIAFAKKYPGIQIEDLTAKHQTQLTPKEKLFYIEKEFHAIRTELGESRNAGRLTREQIFRLCLYKKEMNAVKSGEVY